MFHAEHFCTTQGSDSDNLVFELTFNSKNFFILEICNVILSLEKRLSLLRELKNIALNPAC